MGLAVIVVIAGGAFYLLTQKGNFGLGGVPIDETGDIDADVTGGGAEVSPAGVGKTCSQLCQAGNCADHAAKYCSGCSKCPNSGGTSSTCSAWCKASNCVEYRSKCNGTCSNCRTSAKCSACRKGYEHRGAGCVCYIKTGATPQTYAGPCPTGYELRPRPDIPSQMGCYPISTSLAHAYTGRVTFNESAPTNNPNSIPMGTYKPIVPKPAPSMRARRWVR